LHELSGINFAVEKSNWRKEERGKRKEERGKRREERFLGLPIGINAGLFRTPNPK